MIKPKHIPIRTCVACRRSDAKQGLLRVVRRADGTVVYDTKGKLSGRGAYVCAAAQCIALARKQKKLERALRVSGLSDELFSNLLLAVVAEESETTGAETRQDASSANAATPDFSSSSAK